MLINSRIFHKHLILTVIVSLVFGGYVNSAHSWGRDGHTAIGIMAVNQLQPEALRKLESFVNPLSQEAMAEACNWPDVIRDQEEYEWSGPLHYINIPRGDAVYTQPRDCPDKSGPTGRPTRHCATEAIKYYATELNRPKASKVERWQSFAWLCHLVADLHQPMHAGFADDRGGNNFNIVFNDEQMNLHYFWDTAVIKQQAGGWQYLVGQLGPFPPVLAASNWSPVLVNRWTDESHTLAKDEAYPPANIINEAFALKSWELMQKQLRLSASRLASMLNTALQTENLDHKDSNSKRLEPDD